MPRVVCGCGLAPLLIALAATSWIALVAPSLGWAHCPPLHLGGLCQCRMASGTMPLLLMMLFFVSVLLRALVDRHRPHLGV